MAMPPSLAAEGRAMRLAVVEEFLASAGVEVSVLLDERFANEAAGGRGVVVGPGEELERLGELAGRHDYTLVIAPETGGVLAERESLIVASGGRSLGASSAAAALAGDKLRLARHLTEQGIATPVTVGWRRGTPFPAEVGFPAVVKPADGAGCLETFLVRDPSEIPESRADNESRIVQTWIAGEPLSASFLVGAGGQVALVGVSRQEIVVEGGRLTYHGGAAPLAWELAQGPPIAAVRSVAGLKGWVGVDFIYDRASNQSTVIEINPRLTTSVVGLSRLYRRGTIARNWLAMVHGIDEDRDIDAIRVEAQAVSVRFGADGRCEVLEA